MSVEATFRLHLPAPDRPADQAFTYTSHGCEGDFWASQKAGEPGLVRVYHPGHLAERYPEVVEDAERFTRMVVRAPGLKPIMENLGIYHVHQGETGSATVTEATVPAPERVAMGIDQLAARAGLAAVQFAMYPGGLYPREAFAEELAKNRRVLLAADRTSDEYAHDVLSHASAWALAPEILIDRLQEEAERALKTGPEALEMFMGKTDIYMSTEILGRVAGKAVALQSEYGAGAARTEWQEAGQFMSTQFTEPTSRSEQQALGSAMQSHFMLLNAAVQMPVKGAAHGPRHYRQLN